MNTRRIRSAVLASVLTTAGLGLVSSPASAIEPTGGCWVYSSSPAGRPIDAQPTSDISSSLAPWTDAAASPAGAADYVLTTGGGTAVGSTRTIALTFNKGPKNGGPPASGTAYYYFSVNGVNLPPVSKAFSAPGAGVIPGDTINGSFKVGAVGATTVKLRKIIYDIPSFFTRVQCNGQSSAVASPGANPATTPLDTNVVSPSFTATPGTIAETKAGAITGKLVVGKSLKAKAPTTTPAATVTYQWKRGTKAIAGATGKKYKLTAKDKGKKMSVVMTLKATGYNPHSTTVKASGKVKAE